MRADRPDRTGVLLIRLWIEGNSADGFRARITQSLDSSSPDHTLTTTAVPKDVYATVQSWVEAFVESDS